MGKKLQSQRSQKTLPKRSRRSLSSNNRARKRKPSTISESTDTDQKPIIKLEVTLGDLIGITKDIILGLVSLITGGGMVAIYVYWVKSPHISPYNFHWFHDFLNLWSHWKMF